VEDILQLELDTSQRVHQFLLHFENIFGFKYGYLTVTSPRSIMLLK